MGSKTIFADDIILHTESLKNPHTHTHKTKLINEFRKVKIQDQYTKISGISIH